MSFLITAYGYLIISRSV